MGIRECKSAISPYQEPGRGGGGGKGSKTVKNIGEVESIYVADPRPGESLSEGLKKKYLLQP